MKEIKSNSFKSQKGGDEYGW